MKKKFIAIFAALAVFGCANVFAFGIGAQAGASPTTGGMSAGGGALTFKIDGVAPVFALDVNAWDNSVYIGLTADWWMGNPTIAGPFKWFYGVGGAVGLYGFNSGLGLYAGVRPLIGIQLVPVSFFEVFLDIAWQPGFTIGFYDNGGFNFAPFRFPINLGLRFWF